MKAEDLERFAEDLRLLTSLTVEVSISPKTDGLHTLRINGALAPAGPILSADDTRSLLLPLLASRQYDRSNESP